MRHRVKDPLPRPQACDHCGSLNIGLEDNSIQYHRSTGDWPLIWYCHDCQASVGCHPTTDIPLGRMADRATRQLRRQAHKALDPTWRKGKFSRHQAYEWLAYELGIEVNACHVSWFDANMCQEVIRLCKKARRKNCIQNYFNNKWKG